MPFTVRPAADVDRHANSGRVACGIFDIDAHHGGIAGHSLRAKANFVDAVFEHFPAMPHVRCHCANQSDASTLSSTAAPRFLQTSPPQRQPAAAGRHSGHSWSSHPARSESPFIASARHQYHRFTRQRAAAASHIGVDAALVGIRNDLPEYRRRPFADVLPVLYSSKVSTLL